MAKNADEPVVDDDAKVTEEDLRKDKYGDGEVEEAKVSDETPEPETSAEESKEASEDDGKTDDQTEDEETEETDTTESDSSDFVKEFPNIKGDNLEDYARELERTLQLSNTEGKRLSDALKTKESSSESDATTETVDISDPLQLWAKQNLDKQIQEAYSDFSKSYPQVTDQAQYDQFTLIVSELTNTIRQSQNRLAEPAELYSKAAVILGWKPEAVDSKDKLNMAIKGNASIAKTTSATKSTPRSKVTDQMIAANKLMFPKKSEEEIRKELEPYVK